MSFLKIKDSAQRDKEVQEYAARANRLKLRGETDRLGDIEMQQQSEKVFRPIIQSQKKGFESLEQSQKQGLASIEQGLEQMVNRPIDFVMPHDFPLPIRESSRPSSPTSSALYETGMQSLGPMATSALGPALNKTTYDSVFGITERDGKQYIGNKEINIKGNDFDLDGKHYTGTKGLWDLITLNEPKNYTKTDRDVYKDILIRSNVMHQRNDVDNLTPKSSRGKKWTGIVKPIWDEYKPPKKKGKKGSGTIFLPRDPNALVKRLELIMASNKAGNTGVVNEIVSILDELYRQNHIGRDVYKNLSASINK